MKGDIVKRLKREARNLSVVGCSCCTGLHDKKCINIKRIKLLREASHEIEELRKVLKANVRTCQYFNGDKLCGEIACHMWDDYDTGTEFYCDKHNKEKHFAKNYSGIFKPSKQAEQILRKKK